MILSVVGPGENALAPMTVASTRFGPRRPSAVVDGIGTAGALVERTQYATFNERNAIVRVVLTQESAHSATTACRRAASAALATTRFVQFRPSTMSRDVGVAEPLVDRTDSDPRLIAHATLRFAVAAI